MGCLKGASDSLFIIGENLELIVITDADFVGD